MSTHPETDLAPHPPFRLLVAPVVAALWLFSSCVDTTPPWDRVRAQGGAGGGAGAPLDGGAGAGGSIDAGASRWDGGLAGAGGAIDTPWIGAGGALDAGSGGAGGIGGAAGAGGGGIDVSIVATGGAPGIDGAVDVPLPGTGGAPPLDGPAGADGAPDGGGFPGTGGHTGTGGATGTGGVTGTGGATGTGGVTGTGGAIATGGSTAAGTGGAATAGLVAYYKCDESSGTTLADASGNAHHGTLFGTASFGGGKVGGALVLTASGSGYVSLPPAVFSSLGDFTIATWVNVTTHQDWQRVFDTGINANQEAAPVTGTQYMNLTPRNSSGNMRWSISKDGILGEESLNTSSPSTGEWKHVAIVLTGGLGRLYVDGTEAVNDPTTARPVDLGTIDYAYLGKSQFADPYFDGMLDELRVYDRALSATEIAALYQFAGP